MGQNGLQGACCRVCWRKRRNTFFVALVDSNGPQDWSLHHSAQRLRYDKQGCTFSGRAVSLRFKENNTGKEGAGSTHPSRADWTRFFVSWNTASWLCSSVNTLSNTNCLAPWCPSTSTVVSSRKRTACLQFRLISYLYEHGGFFSGRLSIDDL